MHAHDKKYCFFELDPHKALDPDKLEASLGTLLWVTLEHLPMRVVRAKGLFHCARTQTKFSVQAVGDTLQVKNTGVPSQTAPGARFLFIGTGLDRQRLASVFEQSWA